MGGGSHGASVIVPKGTRFMRGLLCFKSTLFLHISVHSSRAFAAEMYLFFLFFSPQGNIHERLRFILQTFLLLPLILAEDALHITLLTVFFCVVPATSSSFCKPTFRQVTKNIKLPLC